MRAVVDHFGTADGLSSDFIQRLYEDREGDLWVATSRGVDCFRDLRVTSYGRREGLPSEEVDSVLASRDGTIWAGGLQAYPRFAEEMSLQSSRAMPPEV